MLPPYLRDEILTTIYEDLVRRISFFQDIEDAEFLWRIMPMLQDITFQKGDTLYWKGDHADMIFFIVSGKIKLWYNCQK